MNRIQEQGAFGSLRRALPVAVTRNILALKLAKYKPIYNYSNLK
jgi:hypothetical protein